ncbi:PAS domain-containing protein [Brenneria goodwinii]|uniref:methyl-accepting chemotaxis protein n=1 Tax=Brenneria goodwinii TaxID=1109412 RepID=UPI000F2AEBDD|nr:methyl-accepting chemotaxis protein [Brenneria goodwinii]MCG8155672.1 PAS domain-containing protein [Brenneria goodwinii]MCG8160504.1 PAS domain-containing protein [Brenneria goodwinii]MCG8166393.1 PAS domain-containing protein [Brenneria goodwinii]MCG8171044.1 PAS domain-containing protein [Brenneria goodwinii]MCG8176114.1 PAS domain-containing protein [Brenneria goodwinii]
MRKNLPITQNLYLFPGDQTLISITDLQGNITYCNSNFINVSGFTSEELLGQPHNIVRHPDMPPETFRDMWATIKSGLPWTALVKNRRKNGDYYWVRANVTPVRDGDRTVGFLSVRSRAPDEEITAAEKLYAAMRREAEQGRRRLALHRGQLVRRTLAGTIARFLNPGLRGHIIAISVLTAGGPLLAQAGGAPLWGVAVTAAGCAALSAWLLMRQTVTPLRQVVGVANLMAGGDLTRFVPVTGRGEIAQIQLALAQLNVSVRTVVRDVRHEVANLLGGTQEIANGNKDMAARTEAQAGSLEQTAATMEQIYRTIQQTTQLANDGAQHARHTAEAVLRSDDAVQSVVNTMQSIEESSQRIQDIIQVIEGVAFQTDILALNAAVEAARAGEKGRGFAVVATEIQALAQRTAGAAKEVRGLIEESGARVDEGSQRAAEALNRMQEVTDAVGQVGDMLEQINTAAREQSIGVGQVNDEISGLDTITQQNATMVDDLASAANALNRQVALVHNTIRVFRLTERDTTLAEVDSGELRLAQKSVVINEKGRIDFGQAIANHRQWRVTLRNAINRKLVLDPKAGRDDSCVLGAWLNGPGKALQGGTAEYEALVSAHRAFHAEVGAVVDLINRKKMDEAEQKLTNSQPLYDIGQKLVRAIRALPGSA